MSDPLPKSKRLKEITSWFSRDVESGSSNLNSTPSITSPNFNDEPQPSSHFPLPNSQPLEPPNRINALQRDPGLHCPIWEWPVDEQDRVRKAYIS